MGCSGLLWVLYTVKQVSEAVLNGGERQTEDMKHLLMQNPTVAFAEPCPHYSLDRLVTNSRLALHKTPTHPGALLSNSQAAGLKHTITSHEERLQA